MKKKEKERQDLMTELQFTLAIRTRRGSLLSQDENLSTLYLLSSENMKHFMLITKAVGVGKMAQFTIDATHAQQDEFVDWYLKSIKPNKNDIELKLYQILDGQGDSYES